MMKGYLFQNLSLMQHFWVLKGIKTKKHPIKRITKTNEGSGEGWMI